MSKQIIFLKSYIQVIYLITFYQWIRGVRFYPIFFFSEISFFLFEKRSFNVIMKRPRASGFGAVKKKLKKLSSLLINLWAHVGFDLLKNHQGALSSFI